MVKSTKASDPAEAALSAVEEALKIDFGVSADAPKSPDQDTFAESPDAASRQPLADNSDAPRASARPGRAPATHEVHDSL